MSADTRIVIVKETNPDDTKKSKWLAQGIAGLEQASRNTGAYDGRYWIVIGQATEDLLGKDAFEKAFSLLDEAGCDEHKEPGLHLIFTLSEAKQLANRIKQIAARKGDIIEYDQILMVEADISSQRVFLLSRKGNRLPPGRW